MNMKQKSVYQQTKALLCKNFLKKWRMKRESLLEWGLSILLGLCIALFSSSMRNVQFPGMAPQNLGRVDKFNSSSLKVVYTPISNLTQQIMNKTALAPLLKGTSVIGAPNKTYMNEILLENFPYAMGIIFNETFSYKLTFFQGYNIPLWKEEDFSGDFPYQILWHFLCFLHKEQVRVGNRDAFNDT
uniref:ATP binding cassette subfamily A member 6 n=1 Tax=Macaca fascicularis TaxID=9541 RepID=A0A2K5WBK9_MACFA